MLLVSAVQQSESVIPTHISTLFFRFFPHIGHQRALSRVPCAIQQVLINYLFYFIFLTSLLEYNCFTMLCQLLLYNKVNQLYVYIHPHISSLLRLPPSHPPYPTPLGGHRADLPVQCSCFPLAIYFIFGSVYMSVLLSHFIPAYPSPSLCPQVHSLCLRLYSCPTPRLIRTMFFSFLDSIYVCQHTVFVFLFLTYFTLYDRLQVHPPHYKQFNFVSFYG